MFELKFFNGKNIGKLICQLANEENYSHVDWEFYFPQKRKKFKKYKR